MKKINTAVIIYFLMGLPIMLVGVFFRFGDLFLKMVAGQSGFWGWLNSFIGITWGVWIVCTLYLGVALVFSSTFREQLVARMIRLKERDERETFSAGVAAKKTFLLSIAVISFLFIVSLMQFQIAKIPDDQVKVDGHHHILKIGMGFNAWNSPNAGPNPLDPNLTFNFQMPLSTTGILLLLLVWQLGSFHWYSRNTWMETD